MNLTMSQYQLVAATQFCVLSFIRPCYRSHPGEARPSFFSWERNASIFITGCFLRNRISNWDV